MHMWQKIGRSGVSVNASFQHIQASDAQNVPDELSVEGNRILHSALTITFLISTAKDAVHSRTVKAVWRVV